MASMNTSSLIMFIISCILFLISLYIYLTNIKIKSINGFNINNIIIILCLISSLISVILNSITIHRIKNNNLLSAVENEENNKIYKRTIAFVIISVIILGSSMVLMYANIKYKNYLLKTNMYKTMMGYD